MMPLTCSQSCFLSSIQSYFAHSDQATDEWPRLQCRSVAFLQFCDVFIFIVAVLLSFDRTTLFLSNMQGRKKAKHQRPIFSTFLCHLLAHSRVCATPPLRLPLLLLPLLVSLLSHKIQYPAFELSILAVIVMCMSLD